MISVSRLLGGIRAPGDHLRYGDEKSQPFNVLRNRPIVVWNCTRQCNLHCIHCYANASEGPATGELNTEESKSFISALSEFGVPVILFSGGEPLLREDIFELARFAEKTGVRPVLSTNGTLITENRAQLIKEAGFGEVGISLDGIGINNDRFRRLAGAYDAALKGIRNCVGSGIRVSLRFTITKSTYNDISDIFALTETEGIDRMCFYHLAYVGRAGQRGTVDITNEETRAIIDLIFDKTVDLYRRGFPKEILTVDNHADGVYLYLKVKKEQPERAGEILKLLRINGGNNAGIRIGAVDELGNVHADQFWRHYTFGNVRERKFGDIWQDTSDSLMRGLKDRKGLLKGRCATCQYVDICNGNLRVRAEAVTGDIWAEDPACYLTDEEIVTDRVPSEV